MSERLKKHKSRLEAREKKYWKLPIETCIKIGSMPQGLYKGDKNLFIMSQTVFIKKVKEVMFGNVD